MAESNQIEIVDEKLQIYPNNFSPDKTSTYSFDLVATTKGQKIGRKAITITITVIENQSDIINQAPGFIHAAKIRQPIVYLYNDPNA